MLGEHAWVAPRAADEVDAAADRPRRCRTNGSPPATRPAPRPPPRWCSGPGTWARSAGRTNSSSTTYRPVVTAVNARSSDEDRVRRPVPNWCTPGARSCSAIRSCRRRCSRCAGPGWSRPPSSTSTRPACARPPTGTSNGAWPVPAAADVWDSRIYDRRPAVDRTDAVVTLTLNRPDAMNSLDTGLKEALRETLTELETDSVVPGGGAHRGRASVLQSVRTCASTPRSWPPPRWPTWTPSGCTTTRSRCGWPRCRSR